MTSSKSARRARRRERREPRTEPFPPLRTADYDARTIEFTGASDAGLPDDEAGNPPGSGYISGIGDAVTWHPGEYPPDPVPAPEPVARLRAEPRYQPPVPAGYAATTGPIPAIGRPAVSIGDALTRDDHWGRMLAPLPCGHCGTAPPVPDGILERTRIIGHVNWLAVQAGWRFDCDFMWTCPRCQRDDAWKARQGQMELHRFGEPCDRHDLGPDLGVPVNGYRCTCPGAVVAVDVMLASEDHLGSGRGRYGAVTR